MAVFGNMDDGVFSCVLIGSDTLLIECGQRLLDRGHDVRGVVTETSRIAQWAEELSLAVFDATSDVAAQLGDMAFDYLFSITYLSVLPERVISLPRKMAINFHDGPLPRYAGLNAPAWALIGGETEYGVSWHRMTRDVDRGDILHQNHFEIAADETSLSLNTRCFQVGIESFAELIDDLSSDAVVPKKQDPTNGSYFARHARPEAACVLDWRKPARELEALVRALDFGPYNNPLGCAKLAINGKAFLISRVRVVPNPNGAKPGTIVDITNGRIVVAAGTDALFLESLQTVDGKEVSPADLTESEQLAIGQSVGGLSPEHREQLTRLNESLSRTESSWIQRLSGVVPLAHPLGREIADPEQVGRIVHPLAIPESLVALAESGSICSVVTAALAAYLWRLGDKDTFDVSFWDAELAKKVSGMEPWVATRVPFRFSFSSDTTPREAIRRFEEELDWVHRNVTWIRDLPVRVPKLNSLSWSVSGIVLPVMVDLSGQTEGQPADDTPLTLCSQNGADYCLTFSSRMFSRLHTEAVAAHLSRFLEVFAADSDVPLSRCKWLAEADRSRIVREWNETDVPYRSSSCVHSLIEEQAGQRPDTVATVCDGVSITYRELNERANKLAHMLLSCGVVPDDRVGIHLERSVDLVVAVLATMKAGGAYVPLDPSFPSSRLDYMVEDASLTVLITQRSLDGRVSAVGARVVLIDDGWPEIARFSADSPSADVAAENLAYVIYTSGSTGKPKGVMVEHRNVVNFFRGMDDVIPYDPPGVWLAVTTLSFDISVLELFWTLARGFTVILFTDHPRSKSRPAASTRPMDLGLFFWGNDDGPGGKKYELLLESARFADENGFSAVWTPERHFHAFGGPYPNPSVTGAAVAAVTSRIKIRSGSCVLPLHHPIRVAEEWAMIDNLSDGRVGMAFASGWQPHDFVLRPENFENVKQKLFRDVAIVQRLWRGESVAFPGPHGDMIERKTLPRPVQAELPTWITSAGNPETYRLAASIGANVLTHLLGQSVDEVAEKIRIYRAALEDNGYDPKSRTVTLMLHTLLGEDLAAVRDLVHEPLKRYLKSSVELVKGFAWSFPAFKRPGGQSADALDVDLESLSDEELDAILEHAFDRYFSTSGLFGTPESCMPMIDRLKGIGVDEIACLIDYGVPTESVLDSLPHLARLVKQANANRSSDGDDKEDRSIPALIRRHGVTHLQCTPSMARMLLMEAGTAEALSGLQCLLVGGESFPPALARDIREVFPGKLINMYGPTETTIWSSTHEVERSFDSMPIGRPIANTQLYVLDRCGHPMPAEVPGELYIGGEGVARGYFHRDSLTAERFVPDSFSTRADARLYRTGDIARFRSDGVLEFLGRNDHQVKIRGYRIELGEIESVLAGHPAVREVVVIAREDQPDDQRLVGFYVGDSSNVSPDDLKSLAREKLPEYMVPSHIVAIDRMPQTPNGKIDRAALMQKATSPARSDADYAPPEDPLEQQLSDVWSRLLGIEKIGVEDNFFDLGGHSLLVVRLHRDLGEMLDQDVSLTDLYRFPTVRSLTRHLQDGDGGEQLQQAADRARRRRDLIGRRRKGVRRN